MLYCSSNLSMLFFALLRLLPVQSIPVDWQSSTSLSLPGFLFSPINLPALFLFSNSVPSLLFCARLCHSDSQCRIFDYNPSSRQCRLFEGDIILIGSVVPSPSSPSSRVGSMKIEAVQFMSHGQACSSCVGSRYLDCANNTCQCPTKTFFDGSICRSEKLLGNQCAADSECRADLNYTCQLSMTCAGKCLHAGTRGRSYRAVHSSDSRCRDFDLQKDLYQQWLWSVA